MFSEQQHHLVTWSTTLHSTPPTENAIADTLKKTLPSSLSLQSSEISCQAVPPGQFAIMKNPTPVLTTPAFHIAPDAIHRRIVGPYLVPFCIVLTMSMIGFVANIVTCYVRWGSRSEKESVVTSSCVFIAVFITSSIHMSAVDTHRMIDIIRKLDFAFIMGSTLSSSVILLYVAHAGEGEDSFIATLILDIVSCISIALVLYSGDACRSFPSWYRLYLSVCNVVLVVSTVTLTLRFVIQGLPYPEGVLRTFSTRINIGMLNTSMHTFCQGGYLTLISYSVKMMRVALNGHQDAKQEQQFTFFVSHPYDIVTNEQQEEGSVIYILSLRLLLQDMKNDHTLTSAAAQAWFTTALQKLLPHLPSEDIINSHFRITPNVSNPYLAPTISSDVWPIQSVFGYRRIPRVRTKLIFAVLFTSFTASGSFLLFLNSFDLIMQSSTVVIWQYLALAVGGCGLFVLSGFAHSRAITRVLLRTPDLYIVAISLFWCVAGLLLLVTDR
eukprot:PhF_6_TR26710/c1_g1_i13/m.39062